MEQQETMRRRPSTRGHGATLRSVLKPPAKPWRNGGMTPAATPPRVYRVEPREFRDLVQRLTGAPAAARHQQQRATVVPTQPVAVRVSGVDAFGQMNAPWCPFPLMAPGPPVHHGLDGHQLIWRSAPATTPQGVVDALGLAPAPRVYRMTQPVPLRAVGEVAVAGQMDAPWYSYPPAAMQPGLDGHQLI